MARRPSQRPWRRRKNDWVADGVVVAVGDVFDCGGEEIGGGEDFEVPVAGAADAALVAGGAEVAALAGESEEALVAAAGIRADQAGESGGEVAAPVARLSR